MVSDHVNRRVVFTALAAAAACPTSAFASNYVDLDWGDLLPVGETSIPSDLQALTNHGKSTVRGQQPMSSGVRSDWNGEIVRLPGFIVPIDYSGSGVTAFILVPYVGACIHTPPPPANQLVFVTSETPYESKGLYEAVNVIGMFGTSSLSTQLADIAYAISADTIEPFRR